MKLLKINVSEIRNNEDVTLQAKQKWKEVTVNVSLYVYSMAGHRVPMKELSFYSATKHAVTALTDGLRRELAETNSHIRVSVT